MTKQEINIRRLLRISEAMAKNDVSTNWKLEKVIKHNFFLPFRLSTLSACNSDFVIYYLYIYFYFYLFNVQFVLEKMSKNVDP